MKTKTRPTQLAIRIDGSNPYHHLWNNNGTWWCHLTVHGEDNTAKRLRVSLRTSDREHARKRRDLLISKLKNGEWGQRQPAAVTAEKNTPVPISTGSKSHRVHVGIPQAIADHAGHPP